MTGESKPNQRIDEGILPTTRSVPKSSPNEEPGSTFSMGQQPPRRPQRPAPNENSKK